MPIEPQQHARRYADEQQRCVQPLRRAYWDLSTRARGHELMDHPDVDIGLLGAALRGLRLANRWASGRAPLIRMLQAHIWPASRSARCRPTLALLDVGTGSADLPLAVVRWARRRGATAKVVAVDNHAATLRHARQYLNACACDDESARITLCRADALRLPFADASFDDVHASLFLHHFADDDVLPLLSEFRRVARGRVMVNDLIRSHANLAILTAATVFAPRIFRHDGRLSVRRGFRPAELRRLAEAAGLRQVATRRHGLWRFSLIGHVA